MKILLIGEVYSENLGDGIICETVASLIKKQYPHCEIVMGDISGKKDYSDNRKSAKSEHKFIDYHREFPSFLEYPIYFILNKNRKHRLFIEEMCANNYDFAIFVGGQMFFNHFVIAISRFVTVLEEKGIPILFHSCGIGNINGKALKNRLRKALTKKNVVSISVRDNIEKLETTILKEPGRKVFKTFDTALWCSEEYSITKKESTIVGLGIMTIPNQEKKLLQFWGNIISELDKKNIQWQLFCNGSFADYALAKKVEDSYRKSIDSQKTSTRDYLTPRPARGKELIKQISSYKSILSFRLHSHIVASSLGIPSIAIGWDEKIRFFFESIAHKERVFEDYRTDKILTILSALEAAEIQPFPDSAIEMQKLHVLNQLYISIETVLAGGEKRVPWNKPQEEIV